MSDDQGCRPRVAAPGDDDLDLDVDGVTITSVVRADHEIWVRAEGGFGSWASGPGGEMEDVEVVSELDVVVGYPGADDASIGEVYALLCGWRDRAVPLRVCAAPDAMTAIIEDRSTWLPLPRRVRPDAD